MTDLAVNTEADAPLALLTQARAMLEAAGTVDEVKSIRDKAEALRLYAKQANYGLEMQNQCAELKLRAERRAGELLTGMAKKPNQHGAAPTLGGAGINHNQSSRWQRIAALPEPDFEACIAEAHNEAKELTTAGVLKVAKQTRASVSTPQLHVVGDADAVPDVFVTVVADPPWQYGNTATRGAAEDHYATMTIEALCALDVPAADAAHLYLWTTNGFLREAFTVMESWGFTYKTLLTWVKPQIGMGNYFRSCTEHVLFGTRGGLPTNDRTLRNHFEAPRGRHSAKPDSFYDLVEKASNGPFLDMFARRRRLGWSTWGNES